ncbi:hypothetical protein [Treponema sp. C6A8]|uniref:hypothetical protein n=1 Tax=Treponema sp. C6A8 TaxID=1410609 RepID=UPI000484EE50|nr:hypothetical protein [Treponema sp. C6A8]
MTNDEFNCATANPIAVEFLEKFGGHFIKLHENLFVYSYEEKFYELPDNFIEILKESFNSGKIQLKELK